MISLLLKYIWIQYETTYLKENSETQNQFLTYSILCHTTIISRQGDLSENNFTFLTLSKSSLSNPFHPNTNVDLLYFLSYTFTHNWCTFKYPSWANICGPSLDCTANLQIL